ncbi:MAG: FAD-binding protein, partial [Bdellovibrionales bacterium]|nr:FAD-binding protein [Bdellovibrionales bacterium]
MAGKDFDFLVIGGGVAGLTFALRVAEQGSVAVLFKKAPTLSSTAWAQGGVAAVSHESDSFDLHIKDTLGAGAGLCNEEMVQILVEEGPDRIKDLIELGAGFDIFKGSEFHLHQEGGHSVRRIFHAADATGYEIQRTLLAAAQDHKNIEFFEDTVAVDLITTHKLGEERDQDNRALGAYVLVENQTVEAFTARKTLIATGGIGKVYLYTSNPDVSTGDGIAMCCRAGARIANMEFMQFHPTCLYHPQAKTFLITEAMRGEGAKLKRVNGESFMQDVDPRAELAPRDIVARAIDYQMKQYG